MVQVSPLHKLLVQGILLLFLAFQISFTFQAAAQENNLNDLDKIISEAHDLNDFLADNPKSAAIRESYFKALQDYYGPDKMPRAAYDAILKQMTKVNDTVPGFGKRLWETTGLGSKFEIKAAVKTSGLELKTAAWDSKLGDWKETLGKEAGSYLRKRPDELVRDLNKTFTLASKEMEVFAEHSRNLKKAERATASKKFFEEALPNVEGFKEAKAYLMLGTIDLEKNADLLRSGDADLVLAAMDEIKSGKSLSLPKGVTIPENIRTQVTQGVMPELAQPRLEVVAGTPGETDVFRVLTRRGNRGTIVPVGRAGDSVYKFKPVPRRIHGVWKGIPLNECVGGNCQSLGSLTPERWATIALKDSRLYNIERNDSYLGFIQYIPLKKGEKTVVSVDFGAPVLRNKISTKGGDGAIKMRSFFESWLEEAQKDKPKDWLGFVVGKSSAINNAGVLNEVRSSAAYKLGGKLPGSAKELKHIDPMAEQLTKVYPRESYAANYGGNMIADALVPDANAVTILNPAAVQTVDAFRSDPTKFKAFFENTSIKEKIRWLQYIEQTTTKSDALRKVTRIYLQSLEGQKVLLNFASDRADKTERTFILNEFEREETMDVRLAVAKTKLALLKKTSVSPEEKVKYLEWFSDNKFGEKIPSAEKLAYQFLKDLPKDEKLPDRFTALFGSDRANVLKITPAITGELGRRNETGALSRINNINDHFTNHFSSFDDRIADLENYVKKMEVAGQLPSVRKKFAVLLGTDEKMPERTTDMAGRQVWDVAFNEMANVGEKLLPTEKEFDQLPLDVQRKIIRIIYVTSEKEASSKQIALLMKGSLSNDPLLRVQSLSIRKERNLNIPTKREYALADRLLAEKAKKDPASFAKMIDADHYEVFRNPAYAKSKTAYIKLAKEDSVVGKRLGGYLSQIVVYDADTDEQFIKQAFKTISDSPQLRENFLTRFAGHVINPNILLNERNSFSKVSANLQRLADLRNSDPDFFEEVSVHAARKWNSSDDIEQIITKLPSAASAGTYEKNRTRSQLEESIKSKLGDPSLCDVK